jgi:hypothetical protein
MGAACGRYRAVERRLRASMQEVIDSARDTLDRVEKPLPDRAASLIVAVAQQDQRHDQRAMRQSLGPMQPPLTNLRK